MRSGPFVLVAVLLAAPALAQDKPGTEASSDQPAGDAAPAKPEPSKRRVMRLSVADVGRLALRNSLDLGAARMDPDIARAGVDEALAAFDTLFAANAAFGRSRTPVFFSPSGSGSSGRYPPEMEEERVRAGAGLSSLQDWGGSWRLGYDATSVSDSGASSISSLSPRYTGALSLGYRHPLLRGAGEDVTLAPSRAAMAGLAASEDELRRRAELTVADAEAAYWSLVGAIADRDVRRKSLRVAEELLSVSQARLDSGRGIRVEVTEARAGVEARRVDLIAAENDVANRADRLREIVLPFSGEHQFDLTLEVEPADSPAVTIDALPGEPDGALLQAAFERRGDLSAARQQVDAARIEEERAEDDTDVKLDAVTTGSLEGRGSGANESTRIIRHRRTYAWELGLELEVPLGNELARARHRRARSVTMRATRVLHALENSAAREIREATRNVRSAAERIEAAVRSRQASQEQLEAERSRLENGVATPFDVLQVEEDLSSAEAREIAARVDYETARVSLDLALGALLERRELLGLVEVE